MKDHIDLCPECKLKYSLGGKLAGMAACATNGNPCDVCGSQAKRCTEFMDAAELERFREEGRKRMMKHNR